MELEMVDQIVAEEARATEMLLAAAARLESAAERFETARLEMHEIVASAGLEQKLREAEAQIVQLKAGAAAAGRRTLAPGTMMAREAGPVESGALDVALTGLSVEQRIAVKAQMLRSGLLG